MVLPLLVLFLVPAVDVPFVGRPRDFCGAIGQQVRIEMLADPRELEVEQSLILTIVFRNVDNVHELVVPPLSELPEFAERFYIEMLPSDGPKQTSATFRYRLRPKNEQVREIPPLLVSYFDPQLMYFATTATSELIELNVESRTAAFGTDMPLLEPEFLLEWPRESQLFQVRKTIQSPWFLILAVAVPPILFFNWFFLWRFLRPDAARYARLRRSRTVRDALDRLSKINHLRGREYADEVNRVLQRYLAHRFKVPSTVSESTAICGWLRQHNVNAIGIELGSRLFRKLEVTRFGPDGEHDDLSDLAEQFVKAAEESS